MHPRAVAPLLAIAVTAAACAGGDSSTGLADGSQTVEEATASAGGTGDDASSSDADAGGEATASDADAGGEATPDVAEDGDSGDEPGAGDGGDEGSAQAVQALWWTAETVADGSEFVAADLAGEKVVLWMWAPWCSVCNREAPEVAEALADLPDDVTLVGVAGRDDVGPMREFVAEHDLQGMTHVVDHDGSLWSSYGISYQPAWVFVDAEGNASVAAGALGYEGLFAGIDEVFGG